VTDDNLPHLNVAVERATARLALGVEAAGTMTDRQLIGEVRRVACLFDGRHLNARVLFEAADRMEGWRL